MQCYMKKLGKVLKIAFYCMFTMICLFTISIPVVNNLTAKGVENHLKSLPLPPDTELAASVSRADKLTGNGNGMQYFGAILLRSELTLDELETFYSQYRRTEWECNVVSQKEPGLDFLDYYDELRFSQYEDVPGNFYIVYSWGDGGEPFVTWDLRRH